MKMILGHRGAPSQRLRWSATAALIATLLGPLQVSRAAASPDRPAKRVSPVAAEGSLETDTTWSPSERIRPIGVAALDESSSERSLWQLFDGQGATGLTTGGRPTRFRLDLARETIIDALGVYGRSDGSLSISPGSDGSPGSIVRIEPGLGSEGRWARRPVEKAPRTRTVLLEWKPARPGALLPELELWGRQARADWPSAGTTTPVFPDALFAGTPPGAREYRAKDKEGERTIAIASPTGTFNVETDVDPRQFERAFLVYDLAGLPHFSATARTINGGPTIGGHGVSFGAKGGLQVEEIAPASLRAGTNLIQFLPAHDGHPASYRVKALRLVLIPQQAGTQSDDSGRDWEMLLDGRESTAWQVASGKQAEVRDWTFAVPTQPMALDLRLKQRGAGVLTIAAATDGASGKATVDLQGLAPGWHHVPLERLPPSRRLTLSLAAGREQGATITELAISGSPIPVDATPRMSVTYPLSGECVNHKVHVRGFVTPPGEATLFANGTRLAEPVARDGTFAFELGEKAAGGGGSGKAFSIAVEAVYASGARARRSIPIGGCVDRPPIVRADDGRPKQPVDDLGAPYGALVKAGEPAVLAFAGTRIDIPAGAVDKDVRITIRPLSAKQVAPMDGGMTNVSPGTQAFRFGPLGMIFKKPIRMTLPYDRKLLPAGYTDGDVRTFYFDEALSRWEQVGLLGQDEGVLMAATEHFTDFVNATIAMPDHPGTQSINPTSLKDIKLADPTAGITLIDPPVADSTGSANLSFPIEVPPGRRGIQPALAVSYSSDSRNGWLGVGWDLRMSAIQVDTRFGIPRYDGSETYLLDGQMLTRPPGAPPNGPDFVRRVEGRFDRIRRLGSGPDSFTWVVTDKDGTQSFYGEEPAARLADPTSVAGAPKNVFRWSLSRVRDPFGNEMKITYELDVGSNGTTATPDPFVQSYPLRIDYTANPVAGLAAAYGVDFVRGGRTGSTCDRPDAIIDGRPGFQQHTRCLLKQIKVRFGGQLVRQYDLVYKEHKAESFYKSLLGAIEVRGLGGQSVHYRHDFSYFTTPVDESPSSLPRLGILKPPAQWAVARNVDETLRPADGLRHSAERTVAQERHGGLSFGPITILSVGASDTSSTGKVRWQTADMNGDGLPDGNASDGLFNRGALRAGVDRSDVALFSGQFEPFQTARFGGGAVIPDPLFGPVPLHIPISQVNRNVVNLHANGAVVSGNIDWSNSAREVMTLIDMNGDGYPDRVGGSGSRLDVRLNDRQDAFGPAQPWANYAISKEVCSLNNVLGPFGQLFAAALGVFHAAFTGIIGFGGDILKGAADRGGDVLVTVWRAVGGFLFFPEPGAASTPPPEELIEVFKVVIKKNDPPCAPGPGNSCSGGLTIPVEAGDRIYMQITPLDSDGEAILWDPQITYLSVDSTPVSASQLALREPEGSHIYKFSQSADFKSVGRAIIEWTADSEGTAAVAGQVAKSPTSDDVRIRIVHQHADQSPATVLLAQDLPGNASATVPAALTGVSVQAGDKLSFQILSDLPIDPDLVQWRPVVTYQSYCRFAPDTGYSVCGNVICTADAPVACMMEGDPVPAEPVPTEILRQQAPVFYPLFRFQPGTPTATHVLSGSGPAAVSGTFAKTAATPGRVVVAVQGVNRLYAKRVFEPGETGSAPMDVTTPSLQAGDQLFFTVYSDTDVSGAFSWAPVVEGSARPLNLKVRAAGLTPDPSGSGVVDVMGGGYHGWGYGDWNASKPFAESGLVFNPALEVQDFSPMVLFPAPAPSDDGGQVALIDIIDDLKTLGRAVGRGAGVIAGGVAGGFVTFRGAVGKGFRLIARLTGILDLFCNTERPIRITTSTNKGLGAGLPPISAGFNTGSSSTTVELMDMNGDGLPDSVTNLGVRFNTGTQFEPNLGTGALPLGIPRRIEHRSVHIGGSANKLVTITDGSGNSAGFVGAGLGLSYAVAATERDLIDINGDGLPDHVRSDPSGADVRVRLNYGYRFGAEVRWTGAPWLVGNLTARQELANQFGDDLRSDSLRLEDTATNNVRLGGFVPNLGFGAGAATSSTLIRTLVDMVDVNGDGLPDQLLKKPDLKCQGTADPNQDCFRVKLNLGSKFDEPKQIPIVAWPESAGSGLPGGFEGLGLGSPDALAFTVGEGSSGDVNLDVNVPPVNVGGSSSWSSSGNSTSQSFEDIDGDGTMDHVRKAPGNAVAYARLNATGKTNLLKQIVRPLGGKIELDYSREGNLVQLSTLNIDMPKNQWVLSRATLDDGRGNRYTNVFDFALSGPGDPRPPRLSSGRFDRLEREDYGYRRVTMVRGIKQADGTYIEGDGSRVDRFFETGNYYARGLLHGEFESNAFGGVFHATLHVYAQPPENLPARTGTFFPGEAVRSTAIYEQRAVSLGSALATRSNPTPTGLAPKYRIERRLYDDEGNLTDLLDEGDEQTTADDVQYRIDYLRELDTHITRASTVTAVQAVTGTLLRRRTATFDAGKGTMSSLTNIVSGGKVPATGQVYNLASSVYTYTYDAFGNLRTFRDPKNHALQYTYDAVAQTYRTRVDDLSFGYASTAAPDYRFGVDERITDVNGQLRTFTFDAFGRLSTVRGPDDQPASTSPTIQMTYGPVDVVRAWASTKHKDVQAPSDPIETVTFVDGLGRVIQTKKDLTHDPSGNGSTQTGMSVSGMVVFDTRGRVAQRGQPAFATGSPTAFVVQVAPVRPTLFTHDVIGRPLTVVQPDGATTRIRYFVADTIDTLGDGKTWVATEAKDPLSVGATDPQAHRRVTYSDARGNRIGVKEYNSIGTATALTPLITRYDYNAIDELLRVTDAKENVTTADYDTVGQMVALTSPDAGRTEYRYDLAGNLGAKEPAVLRAQGKLIRYEYDFNRLRKIDEPDMADVVYDYGTPAEAGAAAGNLAGRVKKVTMEGGSELRFYDSLGNVNRTETTLAHMATPALPPVTFKMKYTWDWLGRMQNMTFPNWMDNNYAFVAGEGEKVSYVYDRGGNLDRITGFQQTANPQQTSHPRNFTYLTHIGYDAFEQRTVMTSGNGIANRYTYDQLTRRLTDIAADSRGAQEIQQGRPPTPFHRMHYTYDLGGNITRVENRVSVQPWRNASVFVGPMDVGYTYDNLDQVRSLTGKYRPHAAYGYQWSTTFTYDEIGNFTRKGNSQDRLVWDNQNVTPTTDPVQAMAQLGGSRFDHNVSALSYTLDYRYTGARPHAATTTTETPPSGAARDRVYSYDANGNNAGNTFQGTARVQTWDEESRLKEVKVSNVSVAKFRYSDTGERTKKQTAAGDSWYVSQFFSLMANKLPTKHIFAGETRVVSKTDAIYMQVPVINYYHPDHLGSTSYITAANQDLVQHERYFLFGELWRPGTEQEETDVGRPDSMRREWTFTSKEWDVDTGLYYFGARYFDPRTAVWQSPDPILASYMDRGPEGASPKNLGLYTYGWNNPIMLLDPDGRETADKRFFASGQVWGSPPRGLISTPQVTRVLSGETTKVAKVSAIAGQAVAVLVAAVPVVGAAFAALVTSPGLVTAATEAAVATAEAAAGTPGAMAAVGVGAAAVASKATKGSLAEARAARDTLAAELAPLKGKAPAAVTGGYNTRTGEVAARACGGGKCAETHVVEALGGNKTEVGLTEAVRPRTGLEVPVCPRCEATYGRGAFPPGTKFKSD